MENVNALMDIKKIKMVFVKNVINIMEHVIYNVHIIVIKTKIFITVKNKNNK